MDPSNKTMPGFEAPSPAAETIQPADSGAGEILPAMAEQPPAAAEKAPVPAPPIAAPPMSAIPLPGPGPALPTDDVTATTPSATPVIDDNDDIEKVWVDKAKQIVEHTRDDPHKQSQELTVFKADYMKKRYGKTIKISQ